MPIYAEKIKQGESSKSGELKYVRPAQFAKRLAELHRQRQSRAIYTDGVVSRAEYYLSPKDTKKIFSYDRTDSPKRTFAEKVQYLRRELANDARRNLFTHEVYQDRMNYLNALERTVFDIAACFPEHRVVCAIAHHTERYGKGEGTTEWHTDRDFNGPGRITVVATVVGPSTVYRFEHMKARDATVMYLPDRSLVGHTDKVVHATPSQIMDQGRLAIVIDFVRK